MSRQQVLALGVCTVVVYAGLGGLVGLLPLYLTRLGADASAIGLVLAGAYLALALSNIAAGWLAGRFQRRKLCLILGGALAAPLAVLLSRATTVGLLALLLAGLWCALGVPMTMANILTGLAAEAAQRGRRFATLGLSAGLGLGGGGLVAGRIVDRWGFPALFAAYAWCCLLIPLAGGFVRDRAVPTGDAPAAPATRRIVGNRTFAALFVASIGAQAANVVISLSRPLLMDARHFDATAIGGAAAVGSLVTLPLPLAIGWLADRLGRKAVLAACFLAPPLGLLVQAAAVEPWHFWLSSVLSTVLGFSTVAGSALLADLFPAELLSSALALLNATPWIGIVLGFGAGGLAIRALQMTPALLTAVALGLAALLLLVPVAEPGPGHRAETRHDHDRAA